MRFKGKSSELKNISMFYLVGKAQYIKYIYFYLPVSESLRVVASDLESGEQ